MRELRYAGFAANRLEALERRALLAGNALGGEWLGMNAGHESTAATIAPVLSDFGAVGLKAVRKGGNAISGTDLTNQDGLIDAMYQAGQEIHWVINYRGNGINPAGTGRTEIGALDINGATMTTWFNNYKQRCIDLFTRYSSPGNVKIKHYIVGNEPDLNDNFTSLAGRPDIAVKLTRAMWEAAEQVNPAIIVESAPVGRPDSTYLQSMINGGVAAYCDVVGVHLYGDQTQWGRATKPWEWLAAAGVTNKPVGISEAGVTTGWNPTWSSNPRQWQSDWLNDFYVMSKRFGYSYGLLFTHDDDHTADWALLRAGGAQVQPSWNEIDTTLTNPQGLRNAGFESPNDVRRQWYPEHDPDTAFPTANYNWQYATNPHGGSYSLQKRTATAWDTSTHQVIDNLTPGLPVRVTGWIRSDSPSGGQIIVNGSQANDGDAGYASAVVTSSGWTQVTVDVTPTNPWIVISLIAKRNTAGTSYVYFDDVSVTQIPAAPSGLAAVASTGQVALSWTDNSNNETGFEVERATDAAFTQNVTLVTTTAANATGYTNTGLAAGTTYYYRVRATNALGDSAHSNAASATTPTGTPVVLVSYDLNNDGTPFTPNQVPAGMTASSWSGAGGDNIVMASTYGMKRSNQTNAANQNDLAGAITNGDYWSFTVTPNAGQSLSLSQFTFQYGNRYGGTTFPAATGASSYHVFSSIDGFTYNPGVEDDRIANFAATHSVGAWQTATIALTAAKFQNLTAAVTFRIYVADNGSEKDYGAAIESPTLRGTVQASGGSAMLLSAAPEPKAVFTQRRDLDWWFSRDQEDLLWGH